MIPLIALTALTPTQFPIYKIFIIMIQITNKRSCRKLIISFLAVIIISFFYKLQAQVGPTTVETNSTHTYQFDNSTIQKVPSWVIVGGTEVNSGSSGTNYHIDVLWGGVGSGSVTFKDKNTIRGTLNVTIEDNSTPPGANSTNQNYIKNSTYRVPTTTGNVLNNEKIESINYFDGLGRPMQSAGIRAGGDKLNNNLIDWKTNWTLGSGSAPFFTQNGATSENERIMGTDPYGETSMIWRCGNEPDNHADGGWNTAYFSVDNERTYRYTVWVKRTGSQNGSTYHGTQNVNNLDGSANPNPYFWSGDLPQLDTWYLLVGVVHPHTYTGGNSGISGVYDVNGNKVISANDFKWRSTTTTSRFRSYLYYATDTSVRQYFYDPILQHLDGNEASIDDLVEGHVGKDIITHVAYDGFGRQDKEYLPYAASSNGGHFRTGALSEVESYYVSNFPDDISASTPNPFSQKELEASPLGRVLKQAAPGEDWELGSGHEIEFGYHTNSSSTEVRKYKVDITESTNNNIKVYAPALVDDGYYGVNTLYKTVTKDENHDGSSSKLHTTEEFKDKRGRVVLKRTYALVGSIETPHDTYYVYDYYGNLSYVIPPKVVTSDGVSSTELSELCYQYEYDSRNRLVEKQIPGKGREYIVYNKLDQPIMTQDANQRVPATHEWLFTKYDAFGRVAYTGLVTGNFSRSFLQSAANNIALQYVSKSSSYISLGGANLYYANNSSVYPTGSISQIYTINYYDNYTFDGFTTMPSTIDGQTVINHDNASGTQQLTKGLATGSKVRVLGSSPVKWITTQTGYDDKGRAIYVKSTNDYLQTTDIVKSTLDFTGAIEKTETSHEKGMQDTFKDLVNVSVNGNEITKTSTSNGWNAGFATNSSFSGDGYIEFTAVQNNKWLMVGLSSDNSSAHYDTIDFAIYNRGNGECRIYESGNYRTSIGNYKAGDIFRVERVGSTIYYKRNGAIIYTSTVASSGTLIGDGSIYSYQAKINNLKLVDKGTTVTTVDTFTYDHTGRLLSQNQKINSLPTQTIVSNSYDDLGQLIGKGVGGKTTEGRLQNVNYGYNVRGWLKEINDPNSLGNDLFSFGINYNTVDYHTSNDKKLFNGNISETEWKTANDNILRWYRYDYDALNRITKAYEKDNKYTLSFVEYDKNGNIERLARRGAVNNDATTFNSMDNLAYTYQGNQLLKIDEINTKYFGFKSSYTGSGNQYTYDTNGNMLRDYNKGISSNITYNHLNLPTYVPLSGENISYIYDATGVKLKKEVSTGGTTEYAGNYVYQDGSLKFFNHPEGYVDVNGSSFSYVYQYKDHLGNVRLSYKDKSLLDDSFETGVDGWQGQSATVVQENGRLKVSPTNRWQGAQKYVNVSVGDIISYDLLLDRGTTQKLALVIFEHDNNYVKLKTTTVNTDANGPISGTYTVTTGSKIRIKIEKGNASDNGVLTYFYVDNVYVSNGWLEILEENNYYPFGLKHKGYNSVVNSTNIGQKWKYNDTEYEEALGLDLYEMPLRSYDPAIARWTSIDPVEHHSMSTYMAFDGNPIYWADPSGADSEECPSCKTDEDWDAYYSQAMNTAFQLGVAKTISSGGNSYSYITANDRLTEGKDENGRTVYYLDGELMDLRQYDNRAHALGSLISDGILLEAPANLFKLLGKFFKGGGDEAVSAATKTASKSVDDFVNLLTPLDEFDEATTIYRGMTGSENSPSIFFTDNATEAAKYVKNGGSVSTMKVSNFALSSLEQSGQLNRFTGIREGSSVISTEYQFIGENLVNAINQILKK